MGWRTAVAVSKILAGQLARGQTNFLKMLFKFSKRVRRRPVLRPTISTGRRSITLRRPGEYPGKVKVSDLLVHLKVNPGQAAAMRGGRGVTMKSHGSDTAAMTPGAVVDTP